MRKFLSNEYRYFPVNFAQNVCQSFRKNTYGIAETIQTYSNLTGCPPKKVKFQNAKVYKIFNFFLGYVCSILYTPQLKSATSKHTTWTI